LRTLSLNLCRSGIVALTLLLAVQTGRSRSHLDYPGQELSTFQTKLTSLTNSFRRQDYKAVIEASPALETEVPRLNRPDLQIRLLLYVGASQLATRAYLAALRTFLPARDLAEKYRDYHDAYAIESNISWVYLEMNNLEAASSFADQALVAEKADHQYNSQLVISRAFIYALNQDFPRAEALFSEADFYSMNHGDLASAATGWHLLASGYFEASREASASDKSILLRKALRAETEALRLRSTHHLPGMEESFRNLGCIYAGLGDLRTADVLMDRAVTLMRDPHSTAPFWYFFFWRGWLRVQQGEPAKALPDLRAALDLAHREDVVPTDDDRVTFESGLADVYSLFIEAGNRVYLQTRDAALKAEVFEAAEENRAASLLALVPQPHGWRSRLPADYPALLAGLQSAERNVLSHSAAGTDSEDQRRIRTLRASLHNEEVQAGADPETGSSSALEIARRALDPDTLILTFHLGPQSSWLWTVADGELRVFRLPSKTVLASAANQLTTAIRSNSGWLPQSEALSNTLFHQVPPLLLARRRWIVALDRDLFNLPFAALRLNGQYLTEQHSILLAPSIRLLQPAKSNPDISGPMLGLGDAIYNRADVRLPHSTLSDFLRPVHPKTPENPWNLARLSGSGDEVRTALSVWGSGAVLTGRECTRERLASDLNDSTAILHLATHVIPAVQISSAPNGHPTLNTSRSGLIVLGLDSSGQPGFLDMRDILLRPVKLPLVVMSGCASGDASVFAGSGLMGLTRAWLGAGASEVLATRWPVLDDSGPFFTSFYRSLKAHPSSGAAAALRAAQIEMIHSNSYRNRPEYWASYFLVGKV
jgi:CHAT domain-containing protein/tetratricopeptide (TPR) repeat protein